MLNLSVQQSNYQPLGAVDDPMNCCPRPLVLDNSSSGHPQYLGVIVMTVAKKGMKQLITLGNNLWNTDICIT